MRLIGQALQPRLPTPQPEQPLQPNRQLPIELWENIFALATAIPNKDELTVDGKSHNRMLCDPTGTVEIPNFGEQRKVIQTRLSIIQVCKYWYNIGIRALWSHLSVSLTVQSSASLIEAFRFRPSLASFVVRLTIRLSSTQEGLASALLENLPNLRILTAPPGFLKNINTFGLRPEVLVLSCPWVDPQISKHLPHILQNVETLRIQISFTTPAGILFDRINLPNLKNLCIFGHGGLLEGEIARTWDLPSLEVLSLRIEEDTLEPWEGFITQWGKQLQTLEIGGPVAFFTKVSISMPRLLNLYIEVVVDPSRWIHMIQAPILRRFGFFECKQPQFPYLRAIAEEKLFPKLEVIAIHFRLEYQWPFPLYDPRYPRLREIVANPKIRLEFPA